jgi:alpha-1,3-mannosyltransferase
LKDRYPQLRLEWVGADFSGLRASLERRVIELGLSGRVCFRGAIGREELSRLLQRAHLFVSASAYEGFGLSTIEAMSAATVVVVTAVGVHPEVIQDGISGFLVDQDASGLPAQMDRALSLPGNELAAISEHARAATKRFSWSRIVLEYEQLYREVLAAETRSAA